MIAVSMKNVTKDYNIYSKRGQKMKELLTFNRRSYHDIRRALEDVSFEVSQGECLGIIGDNGSGKSTILKILAGTSYPTSGEVSVKGEISYILDVATGFNFDFTGRENIYTKCALLGMTSNQIDEKYDSILSFSGLAERIDHPIKTYSAGMIVRIGFSIAIHIPFEVLIVDEILSVGDYLFQRKCISAIRRIIQSGKTVIITSHSLSDVSTFCHRLVLLKEGRIAMIGDTETVIKTYIQDCELRHTRIEAPIVNDKSIAPCTDLIGTVTISEVKIFGAGGRQTDEARTGDAVRILIRFHVQNPTPNPCIRVQLFTNDGLLAMGTNTNRHDLDYGVMQGHYEIALELPELPLLQGDYYVNVGIWPDEYRSYTARTPYDIHEYRYVLKVGSDRIHGGGLTRWKAHWNLTKLPDPA